MKIASRSLRLISTLIITVGCVVALPGYGAEIMKANNTMNLVNVGAWVGGSAPTGNDIAVWNDLIISASACTNGPGDDLVWGGIKVLNPPATPRVNAGSNPTKTIRLGAGGINLNDPLTTQDFVAFTLLEFTNSQTWNINAVRTFWFNNTADVIGDVTVTMNSDGTFSGTGSGSAVLRIGSGNSGTSILNQSAGVVRGLRSGGSSVQLNIGRFAGNAGIYNLSGGLLDTDDNGTGVLIRIADEIGADGTLNVSGGQVTAGSIDVGNNGTGRVTVSGTGVVTASGTLAVPRGASATGFVNLDGGELTMAKATALNGGNGTFNFNGGTLKPANSATDFLQNLTAANVKEGGARIDSSGYDITIAQPLLHGGAAMVDGGLKKQGFGTLTLDGAGTYNGPTVVEAGKLIMNTLHTGGGSVTINDFAAFGIRVAAAGTSLKLSALTLGNSFGANSEFNLSVLGNPTAPVIWATNLTTHGTIQVDVSGVGLAVGLFPLIRYVGAINGSGFAAFSLIGLPQDVSATLSNNTANSSVDLVVTAAPKLFWTAANSTDWDILTTTNWVNSLGNATYYTDGYPVVFNDSASDNLVNVVAYVSPGGVTVSNNALPYTITGFGQIAGGGPLRKEGTGTLDLSTFNAYTGDTVISSGTLRLGVAQQAIPDGAGYGNVQVDGTLDLAGFDETINGLNGSGIIDNTGGNSAFFTVGNNNSSGTFSGVLQNLIFLSKIGSGTIALTSSNSYSGGTSNLNGFLQLGNNSALGDGPIFLSGGGLTSDGNTRTLANHVFVTTATTWGSDSSSGAIILNGEVDLSGAVRNLTFNCDSVWNGITYNGGINKLGPGTLTLKGNANWTADSEVRIGTMIFDGINFASSQSLRPDCSISLLTARLVVTNGAIVTINASDANIRAGFNANVPATNIYDIAGVITMPSAAEGQGKMILGAGCARGIINLWPGGDAEVDSVIPADLNDLGQSELNFYGGTLRARKNQPAFMQGLTEANVRDGGAVFNTAGFDISVAQNLVGAGSGGVTKNGLGTLTLLGTNTFTGPSFVQEGKLLVSTAHAGGGSFTVADGAAFGPKVAAAGSTLNCSTVTLGNSSGATCAFDLGTGNPTAVPLYATNLVTHGTVLIDVTAAGLTTGQFSLIRYNGSIGGSGFAAFQIGTLPQGVNATLVNTANTIDLLITSVTPLRWAGDHGTDWDIGFTANWLLGASPVTYDESSGVGPAVRFDDTAIGNTSVNLPVTVSPASLTVSNNSLPYNFSGAGKVSGSTGLTKQGSGTLTLYSPNDYSGNTVIENGKIVLANFEVLPDGPGKGNVVVNGSLDLWGTTETINGLAGSGTIDNSGSGAAMLNVGSNDVSGTFSGVVAGTVGTVGLNKIGAGALTLSGNNTYSGGTIATAGQIWLGHNNALGSGSLTLSGGTVASDSTTPRSVTNALLVTSASTLGDPVNNGLLTLSGPMDLNGSARNVTIPSDVVLTGFSSNGRINKLGSGTLIIKGAVTWNGDAEVRNGNIILDGAMVTNTGAIRPDCDQAFGSVRMTITNGAVMILDFATANLRAGYDAEVTSTNFLDVAGLVRMPSANTGSGRILAGRNGTRGIITLYSGADVAVSGVLPNGGYGEVHFNGGIVRATADNSTFINGLDLVDIGSGGLTLDTAGWQLAVPQPLLAGAGSGGIEKIGDGVLALNGTNTYTGTTLVTAGVLAGNGVITGPVTVSAAGTLSPGTPLGALTVSNTVTLGGTTLVQISKAGATLANGLLVASTLNCGGLLVVSNIGPDALAAGDAFDLFDATTFNGTFSSIQVPALPGLAWDVSKVAIDGTISVVEAQQQPQFTEYSIVGSTLNLSGTGGPANATYYVLESTNVAAPALEWLPVQTNVFDGDGNFNAAITLDAAAPKKFFRLVLP